MQWREGGLPPQVVFEVLSPGNTATEMAEKIDIYEEHGVEEFYLYDPDRGTLRGFARQSGVWSAIPSMQNWVSPWLGIVFRLEDGQLILTGPDGQRFLSSVERDRQLRDAESNVEQERQRAERQQQLADQEKARADRLAEKLRALGIDPDADVQ